ncbi:MAG: DUF4367 domain-containing protein [Clostridia bacterium]|nr:DUF4367 domain-containing protein [Clostridia bacterium]
MKAKRISKAALSAAIGELLAAEAEREAVFAPVADGEVLAEQSERMRQTIGAEGQKPRKARILHLPTVRRVALFALVSLAALAAVVFGVPSVRAGFVGLFLDEQDRYYVVSAPVSEDTPTKIETKYLPTYIPEGMSMRCFVENDMRVYYIMEGDGDICIDYSQGVFGNGTHAIDNSEHIKEYLTVNGCEAMLMRYTNGYLRLMWHDGYIFSLLGYNVSLDTLLRVAESLQ